MEEVAPAYEGPSWQELASAYRYPHAIVEFTPIGEHPPLSGKVTGHGRWRSGDVFLVEVLKSDGTTVTLWGHYGRCAHGADEPCTYVLNDALLTH